MVNRQHDTHETKKGPRVSFTSSKRDPKGPESVCDRVQYLRGSAGELHLLLRLLLG